MDEMIELQEIEPLKAAENGRESKPGLQKELFDWLDIIVSSVIAVVIIFTFFFRVVTIKGKSMQNTLFENEKVIISDLFYEPQYGDIVVISRNTDNSPELSMQSSEPIIKRVIATEGQYVDIDFDAGKVYVGYDLGNMVELDEPYTKTLTTRRADVNFPVYVDEGYVFVLGDNRNESLDSRYRQIGKDGLVDKRYILGHAVYRLFPFDRIGGLSLHE